MLQDTKYFGPKKGGNRKRSRGLLRLSNFLSFVRFTPSPSTQSSLVTRSRKTPDCSSYSRSPLSWRKKKNTIISCTFRSPNRPTDIFTILRGHWTRDFSALRPHFNELFGSICIFSSIAVTSRKFLDKNHHFTFFPDIEPPVKFLGMFFIHGGWITMECFPAIHLFSRSLSHFYSLIISTRKPDTMKFVWEKNNVDESAPDNLAVAAPPQFGFDAKRFFSSYVRLLNVWFM